MQDLYIESRALSGGTLLSWDIAHHMYARGVQGNIAVVTDKPVALMAATRKQWLRLMRQVQRERSSTLNTVRIMELSNQIGWMQRLAFSCKLPEGGLTAGVTFATLEALLKIPPMCSTLYITQHIGSEDTHLLTAWMTKGGVVVTYR